jgi:uncharacterized protein (DUF1501 family)
MVEMNRRKFLIASAGVGAAGLLSGVATIGWNELHEAARRNRLADDAGILVLVTMYGGNDGLSTVIPYADNAYHDQRPDLAYAPNDVLPLDAHLGLNPGMPGMLQTWRDNNLAILRGVTYPKPDRSHFRSMDIWQTASPEAPTNSGWIGRWLDATGDDPVRAINIGSVLPMMAVGEKQTASALSGNSATLPSKFVDVVAGFGAADPRDTQPMSAVCASYRNTRAFGDAMSPVFGDAEPQIKIDPVDNAGGLGIPGGPNPLSAQLDVVVKCIKAAVPARVYMVSLGGFDTHSDERGTQQKLLGVVDDAVSSFLKTMRSEKYGKNVVVMMYSEFGRRVAANASYGTDHGTAGPVLVAGMPVKGGFYGEQPSLVDLDDGDLKGTVDFRDIYQELLVETLNTDPEPSVGPGRSPIGFLSTASAAHS